MVGQTGRIAKFCSIAPLAFVVITGLGPPSWQLRTSLGWEIDHLVGYFAITLLVLLAWPRPFVVGGSLMVFAMLLETLQGLTPNRSPNLMAAVYGVVGVLVTALVVELFIRIRRRGC